MDSLDRLEHIHSSIKLVIIVHASFTVELRGALNSLHERISRPVLSFVQPNYNSLYTLEMWLYSIELTLSYIDWVAIESVMLN